MFGAPLSANIRQYGHALPPVILNALKYLRAEERMQLLGLFRRAASKARVDLLKEMAEADPGKRGREIDREGGERYRHIISPHPHICPSLYLI